jgi:hypothetical protein
MATKRKAKAPGAVEKRKRCALVHCGKLATHVASRGYFTFYLCPDCALTAHKPPLNARHCTPIDDATKGA